MAVRAEARTALDYAGPSVLRYVRTAPMMEQPAGVVTRVPGARERSRLAALTPARQISTCALIWLSTLSKWD